MASGGADRTTATSSVGLGTEPIREDRFGAEWFAEHYDDAANQIIAFLAGDGLSLRGRDVADIGCGDGIIDLGLMHKAEPASLVGFDINPAADDLLDRARAEGVASELPANLTFARS